MADFSMKIDNILVNFHRKLCHFGFFEVAEGKILISIATGCFCDPYNPFVKVNHFTCVFGNIWEILPALLGCIFPHFPFSRRASFSRACYYKNNSDVYAVTKKTRFSAYFRFSQVHFPCISQRLLTLTNDTHPLFLTQYIQDSFVLNTITFCSLCIVSFVSISYSVFRGRVELTHTLLRNPVISRGGGPYKIWLKCSFKKCWELLLACYLPILAYTLNNC